MRILFICQSQFGYLVDMYYLCRNLGIKHDVTYLEWDYGFKKKYVSGVEIVSVSRRGSKLERFLSYIGKAKELIESCSYDIVVIKYFPGCAILRCISPRITYVLDIRSGSVHSNWAFRTCRNALMRMESIFFSRITIISQLLARKLFPWRKVTIVPVGSVQISNSCKVFDVMRLLYVGTLDNRNIDQTLTGLAMFRKKYGNSTIVSYSIVGSGLHNQCEDLRRMADHLGLDDVVKVTGYIPFEKLENWFAESNIGVSYVPITSYYDVQPPTKTFDYLLSGLAVIATSTKANRQVINRENGFLIDDTAEAFCEGLHMMSANLEKMDSSKIKLSAKEYEWERISAKFEAYLDGIIN